MQRRELLASLGPLATAPLAGCYESLQTNSTNTSVSDEAEQLETTFSEVESAPSETQIIDRSDEAIVIGGQVQGRNTCYELRKIEPTLSSESSTLRLGAKSVDTSSLNEACGEAITVFSYNWRITGPDRPETVEVVEQGRRGNTTNTFEL